MSKLSSGNPKTFRLKGLWLIKQVIEGLVNHGQTFTFRKVMASEFQEGEYEVDVDADTPESGYNFTPTSDQEIYRENQSYGLLIQK